jgi:gliding motility-associated protein GldE
VDDSVSYNTLFLEIGLKHSVMFFSIVGVLVFLVISALIAAAEVAFFSLEPSDLETLKNSSSTQEKRIIELLNKQKKLIATIVIAHNLVNIGVVVLSENIFDTMLSGRVSELTEFMIRVVIVTFLIVLIGEVIPKIYTKQNALKIAKKLVFAVSVAEKALQPLSYLLIKSTSLLDVLMKNKKHELTVDDLSQALDLTSNETTPEEERKILKGIVEFGNTEVKQIMRPRPEMIGFDIDLPFTKLLEKVVECGFSRIPIYRDNLDVIEGIIYTKDLLEHLNQDDAYAWQSIIRKPFFVPSNKKIDDLLKEFQSKKMHMAIVIDEYGGTSGLVTLEDIIEEIIGDINDEFDDEELNYSKLDESTYIFEAKIMLNDLYRVLQTEGEEFEKHRGESDTLAGFILENTGRIPDKGEVIHIEQYTFTIESVDKRKINRVKLKINPITE